MTNSDSKQARLEEEGVIYFSVTSDGTTGEEWVEYFESKETGNSYIDSFLLSEEFKPTKGVVTEVAVLKGTIFEDDYDYRIIHAEANKRGLIKLNAEVEVAGLIFKKFTNEEMRAMGLSAIAVIQPIRPDNDSVFWLTVECCGDKCRYDECCDGDSLHLSMYYPSSDWGRRSGFAFSLIPPLSIAVS